MADRPEGAWFPRLNALIRRAEDLIVTIQDTLAAQIEADNAALAQVQTTLAQVEAAVAALQSSQPPA